PPAPVGGATDGTAVGAPGASSVAVGQTVAQSGADHPAAVAGLWTGALAPGRVGGARGRPVAARVDGQCALLTPSPARKTAPGKLFRPLSRACAGGYFALKPGSWRRRVCVGRGAAISCGRWHCGALSVAVRWAKQGEQCAVCRGTSCHG